MRLYLSAFLSTLLVGSMALPTTQVSALSNLVIILDNRGIPFPKTGHRLINPRGITPELSSFPVDFNDLPFKTQANIDGENIIIFSQKQEFVAKVVPVLKQYLCSNLEYAPLFPIMCRHQSKSNDGLYRSTSSLVGTESEGTSVRHQHHQSTTVWSERPSSSIRKAFDSINSSLSDSRNPTLPNSTRLVTPTETLASGRISSPHDIAKSTGKLDKATSESRNSHDTKTQGPIGQISEVNPSAQLSSSIRTNQDEQFATISALPSSTISETPARASQPTADPEFPRVSRSLGLVFSTTQIKRPTVSKPGKLPGKSFKYIVSDSTFLSESPIHQSTHTTRDAISSSYGKPSASLTAKQSEPPNVENGRSTKSLFEGTESMPTTPRSTDTRPAKSRSVPSGTSTSNTLTPGKRITLTESPPWRTIRTMISSQVGDHGNRGTGHARPAPVRTKPEWPKELTGTITVRPYPSSTIFTKRSLPIVGSFGRTLASDPHWDTFGIGATPAQDSGVTNGDEIDSDWKEAQNSTLGLVDYAQDWVEGVLDRAKTEYHNIVDSLSNAVGFVNMMMGWDGQDSHD